MTTTAQYIETRHDGAAGVEFIAVSETGEQVTVGLSQREAERLAEELHQALAAAQEQLAATSGCSACSSACASGCPSEPRATCGVSGRAGCG
jgi:hypothetical protein